MFKKVLSVIMAAALIFSLAGCNSMEAPETSAENFLKSLQTFDAETLAKYSGEDLSNIQPDENVSTDRMVLKVLNNMSYEIVSADEKENSATVTVKLTNADMYDVVEDWYTACIDMILADPYMSDAEMDLGMEDCWDAALSSNHSNTVTETVTINMTKADGYWIVQNSETVLHASTGYLVDALDTVK